MRDNHGLTQHRRTHTGERPFKCLLCSKDFVTKGALKIHGIVHMKEKSISNDIEHDATVGTQQPLVNSLHPNSGPVIGFKSVIPQLHDALSQPLDNTKSSLMPLGKNQCFYVYGRRKMHRCAICGMICSDNWKFQRHMTTHSGERPYECEVCHKTYKTEMSLKSHMKRKHVGLLDAPLLETVGGSVEQPLSEDSLFETVSGGVGQATEAFGEASVASLEQSISIHVSDLQKLKYSCSVCGLYCFHSAALQEHVRTHTGEKPFVCSMCGRPFAKKGNLKAHMAVHFKNAQITHVP
ncbi:zinc finger protein 62 homolog [Dreissena polymorpha]|uniref:zinc finger protein 62 homolog n=1 Tax=Dreissena polymorpha TaxID=45954 RepID=UPI00226522E0|nr:zinc finger protein 62 homolog [Dreissena polymorpha]